MGNKSNELTDEPWEGVKELKNDRVMLNAMLWMVRNGAGWEDLLERYGP